MVELARTWGSHKFCGPRVPFSRRAVNTRQESNPWGLGAWDWRAGNGGWMGYEPYWTVCSGT